MLDLSRYVRPGDGVWRGQGGAETVAERVRRLVAVAAPHHREELASSLARQDIPA